MDRRHRLHEILCEALGSGNVYFQPPASLRIEYPCIVYSLSRIDTNHSGNLPYRFQRRYMLTLIDKNPGSPLVDRILKLPRVAFDKAYTADNLHHFTFTIYF